MTRTQNYKILTFNNNEHEFTDIIKGKQIYFDKEISIDFISIKSISKLSFVLIVTRNYTKDVVIKFNNDKSIHIIYDKK